MPCGRVKAFEGSLFRSQNYFKTQETLNLDQISDIILQIKPELPKIFYVVYHAWSSMFFGVQVQNHNLEPIIFLLSRFGTASNKSFQLTCFDWMPMMDPEVW